MRALSGEQCKTVVENAATLLADYCSNHNLKTVVTGSSGGLDSAITLGIAQRACQLCELKSIGVIMPCGSSAESMILGRAAIDVFGANKLCIDLTSMAENMHILFGSSTDLPSSKIAYGNIKARLRMITLYHIAQLTGGMVLSTDNLSEYWMGFWTKHGDEGDFGMIQNILKGTELYDIAEYLGVPQEIVEAKPDDGLGVANGDEDQLGAPYPIVDRVMLEFLNRGDKTPADIPQEVVNKIIGRYRNTMFKRRGTVNLTREQLGLPSL